MSRITPPDELVREEIKNNLSSNILVEAGAGSGKTTSMVSRMVSLVTSGKCDIEKIAAITFTRKAAQELKERFQNKLEQRYHEEQHETVKGALKTALDNIERCYIGTIHSFCAAILRERPVEGAIAPDFTELDELTDAMLHKEAWHHYLPDIRLNSPEKLAALNEAGLKPSDLEGVFNRITSYPDVEIIRTEVSKPELKPVFEKLKPMLYNARQWIPKAEPEKGYDRLQESILSGIRMIRYYDMEREGNLIRLLEMFEKEQKTTLNRWLADKDTTKEINVQFNQFSQTELIPILTRWKEYCHDNAMGFVMPAVSYYGQLKRKQSGLNFQDLLMKSVEMLKNYPEVRTYFQNRYRCLLIDEFQDTDPIQAELMFLLTGQDVYEKDWYKLVPSPGSLFVVGDPKQSIYRFRRADIDIYNRVKQIILKTGGRVLELTANFRSMNTLGVWFNKAFEKLLPSEADSLQAAFSPVLTLKEDAPQTESGVRVVSISEEYTKKEEIVMADARNIAEIIRSGVDNQSFSLMRTQEEMEEGLTTRPRYKDFMVLLRYRDSMDIYAMTLKEYGIPVRMSGGSSLSQVEEINEFAILLKYLADPEDQVLLVAVLRGIFFGISDASLAGFKLAGGKFNVFSRIPETLTDETRSPIECAFTKIALYLKWTRQYPPVTVFEKIGLELGLIPLTLVGSMGQTGCGYIYKIVEVLREGLLTGFNSFLSMVRQLETILEQDLDEELDIGCEEPNAVRIMNLHKAKGLEAPVVFLAHPYKKPSMAPDYHIQRNIAGSQGYFTIKKAMGEFRSKTVGQPVNWSEYEKKEQDYQDAEETRLLYVAATRAKNLLFIASCGKANSKNPWEPLLNFIEDEKAGFAIPETQKPRQEDNTIDIPGEEPEEFMRNVKNFTTRAKEPSYAELSPTEIMKQDPLHTLKGGYGAEWGTAIHRLFEKAVKGDQNIDSQTAMILEEHGFAGTEHIREAVSLIEQMKHSDLFRRIQNAKDKLTEVPFSLKIDKENPIYPELNSEDNIPVYLSGIIDLAIKEEDAWSIIDYKTNYFETEEDLNLLIEHYAKQVKLYCQIWEQITGERVKSGEIYFTGKGLVKIYNEESRWAPAKSGISMYNRKERKWVKPYIKMILKIKGKQNTVD